MTTPTEPSTDPRANPFEPFPEPRTMPGGWDLTELLAATHRLTTNTWENETPALTPASTPR
ncbi:MAG TPA: hypothetical protein VJG32_01975 [Anaerolineae bacterium]|nr:hypothetical protein [Anaerolineae bacterium]